MKLDIELIDRRRRELGLPTRQVAQAVDIDAVRMARLLEGSPAGSLSLDEFERLTDTLGLKPSDLLETADAEKQPPQTIASIGGLLAAVHPKGLTAAAIARALGLETDAAIAALDALDHQLATVGMTLQTHTNDGSKRLIHQADSISDEQLSRANRAVIDRLQLDEGTAKAIFQIMNGTAKRRNFELSNDGRVKLGKLINAGIIEAPRAGDDTLELSRDVRESLLLT